MRLVAFVFAIFCASPCFGDFISVKVARFDRVGALGGIGGGGEFRVTFGTLLDNQTSVSQVAWDANPYKYMTFCLELNESISLSDPNNSANWNSGNVFKVAFSDRAVNGGNVITDDGSAGPGDRASDLTKTIYNDWLGARTTTGAANDVQQAIWKLEENRTVIDGSGSTIAHVNALLAKTAKILPEIAVMNVFSFGTSNSKVLGFKANDSSTWSGMTMRQDQLIKIDGFGTTSQVPEPATAGLLGLGMLVAGAYRARRKAKE